MDVRQFESALQGFTGSTQWFQDPCLPGLQFTEGVKYFIEQTQAVPVLIVAHQQALPEQDKHGFLSLVFEQAERQHCTFLLQDGNYGVIFSAVLHIAELPPGKWEFWMEQGVLYLPSEH